MNLTLLGEPNPVEDGETPRRFGLIAGVLCFCFFFAAGVFSISQSKSSTAVIGYFFLPFYAVALSLLVFCAGWCVGYCRVWYRSPVKTITVQVIGAALVPVLMLALASWVVTTVNRQDDMLRAARSVNTAPAELDKLADSTSENLLGEVAGNPKLPEPALRKLANHGGYTIDSGLARNRSTPADILTRLAASAQSYIRMFVAGNPGTPPEVLADLSRDSDQNVRIGVAQNPSTPRGTVENLRSDSDETVRRLAIGAMQRH